MADLYKVSGTADPSDGTAEVVLSRDKDGIPSKVVSTTQAAELSKADQDALKELGVEIKKVSADEAAELANPAQSAGSDVAGSAPSLGNE